MVYAGAFLGVKGTNFLEITRKYKMNVLVTYFCTAYELKKIDKPKNELYFSYQRFKCA